MFPKNVTHRLFLFKTGKESKHGGHMPMTLAIERLRQEEHQFEPSLSYIENSGPVCWAALKTLSQNNK